MVFLSMKRMKRKIHFERYPSKTIERVSILIHIRNRGDRVPLPTTSPLFLSLIPIFESPPSTIFHGKQYRFRYLPNNSESFSSVSSYERGEGQRGKKGEGREGEKGKKEVEEREREKKKKRRKSIPDAEDEKREADIYTAVT